MSLMTGKPGHQTPACCNENHPAANCSKKQEIMRQEKDFYQEPAFIISIAVPISLPATTPYTTKRPGC